MGAMSRIFSNCIGVCGTHGKTTTSSMLTQILLDAGLDPSAVIGGKLPVINAYGRFGHSQNFVCESCEFNNTFLHMNPDIAVILNIDEDHLDFFKNLDNIKKSFRQFAEKTTKTIVYNGDDENTVDTLKGITGKSGSCSQTLLVLFLAFAIIHNDMKIIYDDFPFVNNILYQT